MKSVLLLGAGSDIAVSLAKAFAANQYAVLLAGRDEQYLNVVASDLRIRYEVEVSIHSFDATDYTSHQNFFKGLHIKPAVTICAFGYLGEQSVAEVDFSECKKIIDTNYVGAVSILNIIALQYEQHKEGTIIGISSVAGDRGRQSNFIYGSAKAGFTAYLSGLRNKVVASGVHVMTLKPGFVKTKMVKDVATSPLLTADPDKLAMFVYRATRRRKNIVYYMPVWRYIMMVICLIPEAIFKKLKL